MLGSGHSSDLGQGGGHRGLHSGGVYSGWLVGGCPSSGDLVSFNQRILV